MKRACIRIATIILLGIATLIASAGKQSEENVAYAEKQTGLIFPTKIGLLDFLGTEDFGDQELGIAIRYAIPGMYVDIYVYNLGLMKIPSDAESSEIRDQFDMAVDDISEYSRRGVYLNLVLGQQEVVDLSDSGAGPRARHVSLNFAKEGSNWRSHLFVLGFKNQFIKVRFSYEEEMRTLGEQQVGILTKWLSDAIQGDRHAQVVAYWKVGDTVSYDVRRERSGNQSSSLSFQLTIRVLEASEIAYLLDCRYSHLEWHGPTPTDPREREFTNRIMTAMDGLRVLARTSELGELIGVVNKEEVQTHADNLMKEVLETITYPDLRGRLEQAFRAVMTPEMMETSALEDIGILLFLYGASLTLSEKVSGQTELPNPLGGPPVQATQVVELTRLDLGTATATIEVDQSMDPESFGKSMEALARRTGIEAETKDKSEVSKALQSMNVKDHMSFDLDLRGAWPDRVVVERVLVIDEMHESDKRIYQRR